MRAAYHALLVLFCVRTGALVSVGKDGGVDGDHHEVERRRRWRPKRKLRIVAELETLGVTVAEVARRYEVSRGLLWQWREAELREELVDEPALATFPTPRLYELLP